jgi:hypothetical protein
MVVAERSTLLSVPAVEDSPYHTFLARKTQLGGMSGFAPLWMSPALYPFQEALCVWAIEKGKAALFEACGLGKSLQTLVWAENVVRHTNKPVLILTPLAVGAQFAREGEKFGIECHQSRDGTVKPNITITNYEQLAKFTPDDFGGVACDESSILKHFTNATQKHVTRFLLKIPYRLLATATPSPNDYTELGTSSEALGYLGYSDMLGRFFVMDDKKRHRMNDVKLARGANTGNHFAKLAYRVAQQIGAWRMKGHAEVPFWRWVCSWARACQKPSDVGFDDTAFLLPPLVENDHVITPRTPPADLLFTLPAFGLKEERDERRRTLRERCEYVAQLVAHDQPAVIWCHMNTEGDLLEHLIPDAIQVKGSQGDDERLAHYEAFTTGQARVMVIKPKIGAWGLNWQHCAHVVTFASHSWEQCFQGIRRCWRFGQTRPVIVDTVSTTGEQHVRENMARKAAAAEVMFSQLVTYMQDAEHIERGGMRTAPVHLPTWL